MATDESICKKQLLEALQLEEIAMTAHIFFILNGFHVECSQVIVKKLKGTLNNWNSCT